MLVRNIAHNLFQQIFQSDDAFNTAVLVDDKTKMRLGFLHLAQHVFQSPGVHHVHRRLEHGFEFEFLRLQQVRDQILAVDKANYVVHRFAIDGQPRVSVCLKGTVDILQRAFGR